MKEKRTISIPNEILLQETAQLIAEGHTVTHTVRGNSMNPFLVDRRDQVVLASFTDEQLCPGAFVLARDTYGRIVLHRIIAREGNQITLMGDGNIAGTEQTTPADVMGLVIQMIRKGKTYRCDGRTWKIYSRIWLCICPARRILLGAWRRILLGAWRRIFKIHAI